MAYEDYLLANFTSGLLGYWKLDEAAGPTIDDSHSTAQDGTLSGTPAAFQNTGIPGSEAAGAIQFDTDSRVQLETAPGSDLRCSEFTVACWFKRRGAGTGTTGGTGTPTSIEPLVTKGRGQAETAGLNCNWFLGVNRDGANPVLGAFYEESTGPGHQIVGTTTITSDTWYFGAVTYDGSNIRLYLDGEEDATAVADAVGPDSASQQLAAIAGALTSAGANQGAFNGDIAHVAVWNTALSGTDLANLYTQGSTSGPTPPTATLITDTPTFPPTSIQIQLADSNLGVDDSTVTSGKVSVTLDGSSFTDYTFAYDSDTDIITLTHGSKTRFPDGVYVVTVTGIDNLEGTTITDTDLTVTVVLKMYDTAEDNYLDPGEDYSNWEVDAGSTADATGVTLVQNGTSEYARIDVAGLEPSTDYWVRVKVDAVTASAGNIRIMELGTDGSQIASTSGTAVNLASGTGTSYVKLRTNSDAGPHRLALRHASGTDTHSIRFTDFIFFQATSRSSAKVAVLGDRTGSFNASNGTAVDNALLHADADTLNVLFLGDGADGTTTYATANDTLKTAIQGLGGDLYPTKGNHDDDGDNETTYLTYYSSLASNNNGGAEYYSKVLGEVEYFFIDDNVSAADNAGGIGTTAAAFQASTMGQWIIDKIAASTARWKVAVIHHPAYSDSSANTGYAACRWDWDGIGIDLVLQAHNHGVERIYTDNMIFYTCGMGGGNHHGWATKNSFTQYRLETTTTFGYLKVYDSEEALVLEYRDTSQNLLDRVKWSYATNLPEDLPEPEPEVATTKRSSISDAPFVIEAEAAPRGVSAHSRLGRVSAEGGIGAIVDFPRGRSIGRIQAAPVNARAIVNPSDEELETLARLL